MVFGMVFGGFWRMVGGDGGFFWIFRVEVLGGILEGFLDI